MSSGVAAAAAAFAAVGGWRSQAGALQAPIRRADRIHASLALPQASQPAICLLLLLFLLSDWLTLGASRQRVLSAALSLFFIKLGVQIASQKLEARVRLRAARLTSCCCCCCRRQQAADAANLINWRHLNSWPANHGRPSAGPPTRPPSAALGLAPSGGEGGVRLTGVDNQEEEEEEGARPLARMQRLGVRRPRPSRRSKLRDWPLGRPRRSVGRRAGKFVARAKIAALIRVSQLADPLALLRLTSAGAQELLSPLCLN